MRVRYVMGESALAQTRPQFSAVTGPGRSGAVAAVYVSHIYGIPFLPFKATWPRERGVLLIADTASESGATLRKARSWYERQGSDPYTIAFYCEPPRVRFWYEARKIAGLREYERCLPEAAAE